MPTKHIVKQYTAPAYYHVYNRASGERALFRDDEDRQIFLMFLSRQLAENYDENTRYPTYGVEIVAYCLMGTHFHLLLYQESEPSAIAEYMHSVSTAYSMYYNRKYKSKGHVFQSSYRASHIDREAYLAHITRYIHLNPRSYRRYRWSSYGQYIGEKEGMAHPERVIDDKESYALFVQDYADVDHRKQYTDIKDLLAF